MKNDSPAEIFRRATAFLLVTACCLLAPAFCTEAVAQTPLQTATAMQQTLVDAIARAERSVVAIAMVEQADANQSVNIELRSDPLGGSTIRRSAMRPTDPDFIPSHYATGVVLDRQGTILTVCHALHDRCDYYITTPKRSVYRATVVAADPRSDLAILRITEPQSLTSDELTPIELSSLETDGSHSVRKGQFVIALGNPHAIARDGQPSAAWGIVSNLNRRLPPIPDSIHTDGKTTLHHFGTLLQIDTRLNLGTSGGALVDLQGRMIGLTTSQAAVAGYQSAAGYAIPLDSAMLRTINTLREGREVEYGFLGVQLIDLTPAELADRSLQRAGQGSSLHGARVERVVRGSPADRFGLLFDDIVTTVNDRPIYGADDLVLAVGRLPLDATVTLDVIREKKPLKIEMQLAKFPVAGRQIVTTPKPDWRGLRVDYSTVLSDPNRWRELGLRYFDDGVLVTEVEEGSPAWLAGLRKGMVVRQIAGNRTGIPTEFYRACDRLPPKQPVTIECIDPTAGQQELTLQVGV